MSNVTDSSDRTSLGDSGKESLGQNDKYLELGREYNLFLGYNVAIALLSPLVTGACIIWMVSSNFSTCKMQRDPKIVSVALMIMLISVFSAGVAGGIMCNLRGLYESCVVDNGKFERKYKIPYYIRPLLGGLTGLFSFFVSMLLFPVPFIDAQSFSWTTFNGHLLCLAIAILAGFSSQEFMARLKAVAKTIFAFDEREPGQAEGS